MSINTDHLICPTCGKGVGDFKNANLFRRHGKVFNGKQLTKIFKNTDSLTQEFSLPENLLPFVTCLEKLQLLNQGVSGITLDQNYKQLIENFLQSFEELHEKFNVRYTNKIHIIESHLEHYLNESKKSLGYYSDQMIEAMHAEADKILNNSGYKIKDLDSDICGEKLENFVHHLNSYNLTAT